MTQFSSAMFLGLKYQRMTISLEEACSEIGLKYSTGANQISAGTFPIPSRKEGGKRVVDIRDLGEYLDNQRKLAAEQWEAGRIAA